MTAKMCVLQHPKTDMYSYQKWQDKPLAGRDQTQGLQDFQFFASDYVTLTLLDITEHNLAQ